MCDANYLPGHYHSSRDQQKGFKGSLNFHQLQWLFCGIDEAQVKPMRSVGYRKSTHINRKWLFPIYTLTKKWASLLASFASDSKNIYRKKERKNVLEISGHEWNSSRVCYWMLTLVCWQVVQYHGQEDSAHVKTATNVLLCESADCRNWSGK